MGIHLCHTVDLLKASGWDYTFFSDRYKSRIVFGAPSHRWQSTKIINKINHLDLVLSAFRPGTHRKQNPRSGRIGKSERVNTQEIESGCYQERKDVYIVKRMVTGKPRTLLQSVTTHDGHVPLSHLLRSAGLVAPSQGLFFNERHCTLLIRIPGPQVTEH